MDFMLDKISWILKKFGGKIPKFTIPWDRYQGYLDTVMDVLNDMNVLFPIDAILSMLVIWGMIRLALLIIWTVKFIRELLPF